MISAPDVMMRLAAAGIRLKPLPDGRLWAEPRAALTDDLRELIRAHRSELLAALSDPLPDPAAEARRQRVLAMLEAYPEARYATLTDLESDPETVILALAIRGQASCELRIPRDLYDPFLLLDLIERHCGTVH